MYNSPILADFEAMFHHVPDNKLINMSICRAWHRVVWISLLSVMAVATATRHRRMKMWTMKHLGSGHQHTPVMEHVTYMVAIGTGNGQEGAVPYARRCYRYFEPSTDHFG